MGLFDFFKKKTSPLEEMIEKMHNSIFPKGPKDINAGTDELLCILENKVSREVAKSIFLKSTAISRISEKFDKERLRTHLAGYAIQYFTEKQLDMLYNYLIALKAAMMIHQRTPSEVKRDGETYFW